MKIVFICSSLEPGRDGVGDYVSRLAAEIVRQGHQVSLIALNDSHIKEFFFGIQVIENINLTILRLPSILSANNRFIQAKTWISKYDPDWLSLQYVPFSFQSKGLPFGLSKKLLSLSEEKKWHIMLHELWVGMNKEASLKFLVWGWLQQKLIRSLIQKLKPVIIHTQASLYKTYLNRLGINVQLLPLFSNIPIFCERREELLSRQEHREINFILFGAIHPNVPVERFVKEAVFYSEKNRVKLSLTIIGHYGIEQNHWASIWKNRGLQVNLVGEQSTKNISKLLNKASIGISTTAFSVIDKSSSVATMLGHGISIICVSNPFTPRIEIDEADLLKNVVEYKYGNFEKCLDDISISKSLPTSQEIANKLIDSFRVKFIS